MHVRKGNLALFASLRSERRLFYGAIMNKFFCVLLLLIFHTSIFAVPYSVNLMWVNRVLDDNQKYFCSTAKTENEYQSTCLKPIIDWMTKSSSDTRVRVWYDSAQTARWLVDKAINDIGSRVSEMTNISFDDVRNLEDIKQNQQIFSDSLPIYFRVDLLRAIVADNLARKNPTEYLVYADFNVPALTHDELFDVETLKNLDIYGFVMAENAAADSQNAFENAFFILDPKNASLMQASRRVVVELNLKRGQEFLAHGYTKKNEIDARGGSALCRSKFEQSVYVSYNEMLVYYLYLEMAAEFVVEPELKENLRKLFDFKRVDPGDTRFLDAMVNAQRDPLWRNKIYAFSPLFKVKESEPENRFLFSSGFANVGYVTLFHSYPSKEVQRLLYLRPIAINKEEGMQAVADEKARRKAVDSNKFFSPHRLGYKAKLFFWEFEGHNDDEKTMAVGLSNKRMSRSNMPIKNVNKPASKFYSRSAVSASENDC